MSQPESTEIRVGILSYINVYTVMLGLSLVAVVLAIVLLTVELSRYDWDTEARTAQHLNPATTAAWAPQRSNGLRG